MANDGIVPVAKAFPFRVVLGAAALAAVLSASCVESTPAGPTTTLIPANAIAAVVVESPFKLYKAADEFWKSAGLVQALGSDLQGLFQKALPDSDRALEALDTARPWALAVLPVMDGPPDAKPEGKRTRTFLYLPFRSAPEELVSKLFGKGSLKLVARAKGYIVLSDLEGQISFPPAKGADLSRLTRYPASSVKVWGEPAAIRRATSDGFKPVAEAMRRFASDPTVSGSADSAQAVKALGEIGLAFLSQLGLADAAIELGSAGLTLRVGAASAKGSDLQKVLAAASSAPSALGWTSQLRGDALYSLSWSTGGILDSGLYRRLNESLYAALGLPSDVLAKVSAIQARWSKAGGSRGAMNLDMDIDAAALAAVKNLDSNDPSAISGIIKDILKFKFDLFHEVKDEAAYRALLAGLESDPDYLALSKAYAEAIGVSLSMRSREMKDGAFSYGELGFKFKIVEGGKLDSFGGDSSSKAAFEAALAAVESLLSARWSISKGRFVATSGSISALRSLVSGKAAEGSLAAESAFAAFAKTMPPKTLLVGSLSMKRLMSLVGRLAAGSDSGSKAQLPDPALFGSWYSYLAVDARGKAPGLEAGLLVPASDLGAFVRMSGAFSKPQDSSKGGV